MCRFITLIVQGSDATSIAPIVMRHGRRAQPVRNPAVASMLNPGEAQFLTTVGHCDCNSVLGQNVASTRDRRAEQMAKLGKKGWSQSKIERWLADRDRADERAKKRQHDQSSDSIDLWSNIVHDLLAIRGVEQAGLLLHFYSGDVATEVFDMVRSTVCLDDFAARLEEMGEDELLMAQRR